MEFAVSNIVPLKKMTYTDPEIVEGVLCGDPGAGKALAERFSPLIHRRVWRLMGADSEHADIVQQVFFKVVQGLPRLTDRQALVDWVGRVTVNVVRNELRRRRYRRIVGLSTETAERALDENDPDLAAAARRGVTILNAMKVDDRIAFVLRYVDGAELREVAQLTDCSLATVKRRLVRARDTFLKKAARDPMLAHWVSKDEEP